jgi:hypothetical protein
MIPREHAVSPFPAGRPVLGLCLVLVACGSARAQWTATALQPVGTIRGASAGELVGSAPSGPVVFGNRTARAGVWNVSTGSFVDVNPDQAQADPEGFVISDLGGVGGGQQVGAVSAVIVLDQQPFLWTVFTHAGLWSGTAASWIDLHPQGFDTSYAYGVDAGRQVGQVINSSSSHAALWNGSAVSWVDLHPAGMTYSAALAVAGGEQVGYAYNWPIAEEHACVWSGTAASWTDLNPAGASRSRARAVGAGHQGGSAHVGGSDHAALWSGTAASWVDLHPAGASESAVYAILGAYQAGTATFGGVVHPGVWTGTSASWVDLSAYGEFSPSTGGAAYAMSSDGVRLYVAGYPMIWSRPICAGDFNRSGTLEVQDIFDFLNAWFGSDPAADFNGNGLSVQDIFDFLNAWFAGC